MKNVIAGLEEGLQSIAEAIGGGGGVPSTVGHNLNDILVIEDTTTNPPTANWNPLNEILPNFDPNYYPSNGEVITYNSSTHKAEWQTPQSGGGGLPDITSSDNGKVLQATYNDKSGSGYAEWVTPSGGSSVGHYNINIADLYYNDKAGTYSGSISIPIDKNIIGCNAVVVSSPTRMQCPVSKFTIESDGSTTWVTIVISSSVYNEISTDFVYIDIIYA